MDMQSLISVIKLKLTSRVFRLSSPSSPSSDERRFCERFNVWRCFKWERFSIFEMQF